MDLLNMYNTTCKNMYNATYIIIYINSIDAIKVMKYNYSNVLSKKNIFLKKVKIQNEQMYGDINIETVELSNNFDLKKFNIINEYNFVNNNIIKYPSEKFIDYIKKVSSVYDELYKLIICNIEQSNKELILIKGDMEIILKEKKNTESKSKKLKYNMLPGYEKSINYDSCYNIYTNSDIQLTNLCTINNKYYNIYINQYTFEVVIKEKKWIPNIHYYFPELELVICKKIKNDDIDDIKSKLQNNRFISKENLIEYLNNNIFSTRLNFSKIKKYIIDTYIFTKDKKDRIIFTDIYNEIINGLKIKDNYKLVVKRALSSILYELNLNKKRYSGGMYWYGLIKKEHNYSMSLKNMNITIKNKNEILNSYKKEIERRNQEVDKRKQKIEKRNQEIEKQKQEIEKRTQEIEKQKQ